MTDKLSSAEPNEGSTAQRGCCAGVDHSLSDRDLEVDVRNPRCGRQRDAVQGAQTRRRVRGQHLRLRAGAGARRESGEQSVRRSRGCTTPGSSRGARRVAGGTTTRPGEPNDCWRSSTRRDQPVRQDPPTTRSTDGSKRGRSRDRRRQCGGGGSTRQNSDTPFASGTATSRRRDRRHRVATATSTPPETQAARRPAAATRHRSR